MDFDVIAQAAEELLKYAKKLDPKDKVSVKDLKKNKNKLKSKKTKKPGKR